MFLGDVRATLGLRKVILRPGKVVDALEANWAKSSSQKLPWNCDMGPARDGERIITTEEGSKFIW